MMCRDCPYLSDATPKRATCCVGQSAAKLSEVRTANVPTFPNRQQRRAYERGLCKGRP